MTKRKISTPTRQRLELMTATTDGFVIAEADLKMRGPGDIEGTMQSGIPFDLKIASLATDGQCVQMARMSVDDLLEADPTLTQPGHTMIVGRLMRLFPRQVELSRIS